MGWETVKSGIWGLAAVCLPLALPAAAAPFEIGIGGYFNGYLAGSSQQDAAGPGFSQPGYGLRRYAIFRESRLTFEAVASLAQGTRVGAHVELRGETALGDQVEKSYAFFDTAFGLFQIGKLRGAAYNLHYANPDVQADSADPWNLNFGDFNALAAPGLNLAAGGNSTYVETGRSDKIVYYTPRIAGLQLGVSFTPDGCAIGAPSINFTQGAQAVDPLPGGSCGGTIGNAFMAGRNIGQQSQVLGLGAGYDGTLGPVQLRLSFGYMRAKVEAQPGAANTYRGQQAWDVGGQLAYAGFTLGAAWQQDNLGLTSAPTPASAAGRDARNLAVGLAYDFDRWRVGINYVQTSVQGVDYLERKLGRDGYRGVEIGGAYTLGPGVILTAGAEWQQWTSGADHFTADRAQLVNRGWAYQVGTLLRF